MKYPFKNIALFWRPSRGSSRIHIGNIKILGDGSIKYSYISEGVESARIAEPTFDGYPGLPIVKSEYRDSKMLISLFSLRLINIERSDRNYLLDFWLLDDEIASDPIMLLAMTQGMSLSDFFEFVPAFLRDNDCKRPFVTDIAGVNAHGFDLSQLSVGMKLQFEKDTNNQYDKNAIKVMYNDSIIGYIKKGHNLLFKGKKNGISLFVHKVIITPTFSQLYVKVIY